MLDIEFIRNNPDKVKKAVLGKKLDPVLVEKLLAIDKERRELILEIENLRAKKNLIAKEGKVSKEGKKVKEELKEKEPRLEELEKTYKEALYKIPNIISPDVPEGKDETENKVIREWGKPRKFDFKPQDHVFLGQSLDVIDIERASKVSGTRFGYLKGDIALLEFALIQFTLGVLTDEKTLKGIADKVKKGYSSKPFIPVVPPVLIKPEVYVKMARLSPETEEERYFLPKDNQYLIGSAEHTLGPMHMDETIGEEEFPLRYVGFSTCFRREAGAYGKDTRGILRVHQFDKIEMESFTSPLNGEVEQEFIVSIQEHLLQSLAIPYRVIAICTGDMGGPDYKQIDINAWLPGQDQYRETHTSDYMTDYQSRRLNTKIRNKNGKSEFVHMNDATAFAIGRTIIAIMENYQEKDGSILVPEVLQKWMGKNKIASK